MSAPRMVRLTVNERVVEVPSDASVAAAIGVLGVHFRRSLSGQPRAPLCGMGVCFECRVCIDGVSQQRACMVTVRDGMQVHADD